jgi:hypothetical protein
MKYRILWNYYSEGMIFHTDDKGEIIEFNSINEAVHTALELRYTSPFEIVSVAQWRAEYYPQE